MTATLSVAALQRKVKPEIVTAVGVRDAGTEGAAVSGSVVTASGADGTVGLGSVLDPVLPRMSVASLVSALESAGVAELAIIAQDPGYVARRSAMLGASAYTLVGLPDTQNYSSSYPQIFASQTNWVQLNATALDIQYVSHYGDIVNNADQDFQWVNADNAMRVLDDMGIPY